MTHYPDNKDRGKLAEFPKRWCGLTAVHAPHDYAYKRTRLYDFWRRCPGVEINGEL